MTRGLLLFTSGALGAAVAAACGGGSSPAPTAAAAPDAGIVERGAAAVIRRGCRDCHQPTEQGAGTLGGRTTPLEGTNVYPNNLTPDVATGLGGWTDDQIARAIRDGFDAKGHELCLQMARFKDMSDDEALEVVTYLRSLPAVENAVPASHCGGIKP